MYTISDMQVRTHEGIQEINVTTVTLSHNTMSPGFVTMFHCPVCGSPVVQYSGFVVSVFPGMEPCSLPLIVKCSNKVCSTKYLFRTIV